MAGRARQDESASAARIFVAVARRGRWHGRRLVTAALITVAAAVAVSAGTGWPHAGEPVWTAVVALTALLTGLNLATFVPERGSGAVVDLGCGSCAVVAALAPVLAVWWLASSPVDLWTGVLAVGVTAAALAKRLSDPQACPR